MATTKKVVGRAFNFYLVHQRTNDAARLKLPHPWKSKRTESRRAGACKQPTRQLWHEVTGSSAQDAPALRRKGVTFVPKSAILFQGAFAQ
jgi:hypothetical protein